MSSAAQPYNTIQASYNYGRGMPKQQAMVGNFVSGAGPDGFTAYPGNGAHQLSAHKQMSGQSQSSHQNTISVGKKNRLTN